ncbi:MAG: energy transducer TonB [Thiobacillaceae bacterium]|nr:energy transducer TonB [Thiobacillaceae bacterium]MCX7673871.1 energy transducer TonB [Thiobacillaceae bacterium]MDW8322921.1 energy transducer TonB [Burkholderiales bacterium]
MPQIPVPFDTRWYTAREVDSRPQPLGDVLPTYPEEARALGLTGSVLVALHIDETGEVRAIEILESHPPGVFDEAVRAAYAQARFLPAFRAGRAVRYVGKYRVLFELD